MRGRRCTDPTVDVEQIALMTEADRWDLAPRSTMCPVNTPSLKNHAEDAESGAKGHLAIRCKQT